MMITLIGYRGCGKSTVAPLVARELGWNWVDSDDLIETQAGCSILQIFADEGEAGFRQRETAVLRDLLSQDRVVVAAGGGAVLARINRDRMKSAGAVIWLTADVSTLAGRIANDANTATRRPSLTGTSVSEEIRDVLAIRRPIYQDAATHVIDTELLTLDQIVQQIVRIAQDQAAGGTRA